MENKNKLVGFFRWLFGLDDEHCGGCAINCHLQHPNCANGRERAERFYRKHPELRREENNKQVGDMNEKNI